MLNPNILGITKLVFERCVIMVSPRGDGTISMVNSPRLRSPMDLQSLARSGLLTDFLGKTARDRTRNHVVKWQRQRLDHALVKPAAAVFARR